MARRVQADVERVARGRYWREADARVLVEAWRSSGEPIAAFARRHRIRRRRLERWARRLGPSPEVRFHPVRLVTHAEAAPGEREPIEVQLTTGHRVRVPRGFQPEELRQVLSLLREVAAC